MCLAVMPGQNLAGIAGLVRASAIASPEAVKRSPGRGGNLTCSPLFDIGSLDQVSKI